MADACCSVSDLGSTQLFYPERLGIVSITSCIWIMVFAVLGFSTVNALFPMVFASVAQCTS